MVQEVTRRTFDLYSEGTRIAAELFTPATTAPAAGHPAVLLCHGWGGTKDHLARYAEKYARAGFASMTFDYRGWGASDGRIIPEGDAMPLLEAGVQMLQVRVLRETIDPIDRAEDIVNCLSFLASEPGIDPARIGLWGTSYGGGHVVYVAGNDDRVKAVVAQIGGYGFPPEYRGVARARAGEKVRGKFEPIVPQNGLDGVPGLKGTPDIARMGAHSQLGGAAKVRAPTLIIDAEFEELNNRLEHGWAAYMMIRQQAPAEYHTFPCKHYAVYDQYFDQSTDLALDWYRRYL
jgi:dienelactone hydrolase